MRSYRETALLTGEKCPVLPSGIELFFQRTSWNVANPCYGKKDVSDKISQDVPQKTEQ
jgi:hypothetical protein